MPGLFLHLLSLLAGTMLPVLARDLFYLPGLSAAALACLLLHRFARKRTAVFALLTCVFVAMTWSTFQLRQTLKGQLPEDLEGLDLCADLVVGRIHKQDPAWLFDGRIAAIKRCGSADSEPDLRPLVGKTARLSWRQDQFVATSPASASVLLRPGQHWRVSLRLKRPRGLVNPGGFDYQVWLLQQNYSATGYIKSHIKGDIKGRSAELLKEEKHVLDLSHQREQLAQALFHRADRPLQPLLQALLIGKTSAITAEQWQVMRNTGTSHLMAISGLHIGLVAFFAFVSTRWLLALLRVHRGVLLFPALLSVLFSGAYAALSGFAIPAQRAWFMVGIVGLLLVVGRKIRPLYLLLLAALLVQAINPLALTQNGFSLSFLAVFFLLYTLAGRARSANTEKPEVLAGNQIRARPALQPATLIARFCVVLRSLAFAQWVIFCGLSVVLILRFLPLGLLSPFANLVAVPLVSFVVIPLVLVAGLLVHVDLTLARLVLDGAHAVLTALWCLLEWMASLDWLLWVALPFGWATTLLAAVAVLLFLAPRALNLFLPGAAMLLVVLFLRVERDFSTRITALDAGQGLAVAIETPQRALVYDTGAKFSESFDIGSAVIAPYFRYRGHHRLDLVVVSHADLDHAGGLDGLLASIPVGEVAANHLSALDSGSQTTRTFRHSTCAAGQAWRWDKLELRVLWPNDAHNLPALTNDASCVIWLRSGNFNAIFAGDISRSVEYSLLADPNLPRNVDLLIAPHHGSNSSSSPAFIDHLRPKHVVFSAGYKNRYRHPANKVLERYQAAGTQMWTTATMGAITFEVDESGAFAVGTARYTDKRPWFD